MIGSCQKEYHRKLMNLVNDYELSDNVVFTKFFIEHNDMFKQVQKARFALLPVKLDVLPSTVLESMALELPIVTYKTSGMPHANKYGEAVLISEINDIEGLAFNMIRLLEDQDLRLTLISNAKKYMKLERNNEKNIKDLITYYRSIIDCQNDCLKIDHNLLFNTKEFPN